MGMPNITISFKTSAAESIKRSDKGVIGMILKSATSALQGESYSIKTSADIPSALDDTNADYIKRALKGYINPPKEIKVYIVASDSANLSAGTGYFETVEVDYLVGPYDCSATEATEIATWVGTRRAANSIVKAVLPSNTADSEGVINFTTEGIKEGNTSITTAAFCSRVAGIIVGTPMKISATYAPLAEVTDLTKLSKADMDTAVDAGKFIIWHDGKKVKTGRAVNSLTTTTADKGAAYKKIKVVEVIDMIQRDIRRTCEDSYIGKYPNSYDNKCLLISAIKGYLESLEAAEILGRGSSEVGIDVAAQTIYLKGISVNTDDLTEQEIKEYATGSNVYIACKVVILDAIEDVAVSFGVTV